MPTGRRQQRYVLDIDDVVREGFLTKQNAEAIIRGLTGSDTTAALGIPAGGTGSLIFSDKELIYYDADAGRLKSSGYNFDILGQIVSAPGNPWNTGVILRSNGVDTVSILDTGSDVLVLDQSVPRPADSQWVLIKASLSFMVDQSGSPVPVTEIKFRIGGEAFEPTGLCKTFSGPFPVGAADNSYLITWHAELIVPDNHLLDDPFHVSIFVRGAADIPSSRSGFVHYETRGPNTNQVPSQIRGIPTFLDTPVPVFSGTIQSSFTAFDISGIVPAGSSAVILQSNGQCSGPDSHNTCYVQIRKNSLSQEIFLTGYRAAADDDATGTASQGIFPFQELAGVRTFEYKVADSANAGISGGTVSISVVGYVT
jgi:hypothetical protein